MHLHRNTAPKLSAQSCYDTSLQ